MQLNNFLQGRTGWIPDTAAVGIATKVDGSARRMITFDPRSLSECFIHRLPYDVLYQIFVLALSFGSDTPQNLTKVCSSWRGFALESPALWTNIRFGSHPPYQKQRAYIKRSRDSRLDISIINDPCRDCDQLIGSIGIAKIMRLILPHVNRWRSLQIDVDFISLNQILNDIPEFPHTLETLSLSLWSNEHEAQVDRRLELHDKSHVLAQMRCFQRQSFRECWKDELFRTGPLEITALNIDARFLPSDPALIFSHVPNLRYLRLDLRFRQVSSNLYLETVVQALKLLPYLEELDLCCSPRAAMNHLSRHGPLVDLPNLKRIGSSGSQPAISDLLPTLLMRLNAPNLEIGPSIRNADVFRLYNSVPFPNLTSLTLWKDRLKTELPHDFYEKAIGRLNRLELLSLHLITFTGTDILTIARYCPPMYSLYLHRCDGGLSQSDLRAAVLIRSDSQILRNWEEITVASVDSDLEVTTPEDGEWLFANVTKFSWAHKTGG